MSITTNFIYLAMQRKTSQISDIIIGFSLMSYVKCIFIIEKAEGGEKMDCKKCF